MKDQSQIDIQLDDFSKDTRVHVVSTHYLQAFAFLFPLLKNVAKEEFASTLFPFATWKNLFLSDREMNEEIRYVLDRKYAKSQVGNTLDKPRLLLKRKFHQNTQYTKENVKEGTQYDKIAQKPQAGIKQNVARNAKNIAAGRGHDMETMASMLDKVDENMMSSLCKTSTYQNFLRNAPKTFFNLKPDKDGKISFKGDLKPYTQMLVVALDKTTASLKQVHLGGEISV